MLAKVLLLFFVFSFLFKTDHSLDQDLGRHIKLVEIITQTYQIPKVNLFSYTNPDFAFVNTHWLFEVIAYWFSKFVGIQTFLVFKIIIFLLSIWLMLKVIPKENQVLLLPIGFIILHVLRERLELRPEIFSFLFTALTLFILEKFSSLRNHEVAKQSSKSIFFLPIIQLLWVNTHIYFFIGLILQAIYIIYMSYQQIRSHVGSGKLKLLIIIFALSAIVSLINPNGLSGVLYPLNVTKNYGYTIVENQTMFLLESINFKDPNFLFVKISIGIILISITITRDDKLKNILLSLSGVVLALLNTRSFPYLVFLSLPSTLANFGAIKAGRLAKTVTVIFAGILLLESYLYLSGSYYRYTDSQHQMGLAFIESGKGAMDFVLSNDLPGPIYNNFDIGSYIIYRGYQKYKVFVDGRPEAFPKNFFLETYIPGQSDYSNFKKQEEKYQFKTMIFSHTDQTPWAKAFLQSVFKDPSWKLVFIDNVMVILVKDSVVEEKKLEVVDLSKLSPNQYDFKNHRDYLQLGLFLFSQNQASGKPFIEKTLQLFPDSPAANAIMAQITGDPIYSSRSKNNFFW